MTRFARFLAAAIVAAAVMLPSIPAQAQALSGYARTALIGHLFRTATFTKPTVLAIALGTACSASSFTEITQTGSYARVTTGVAPGDANWAATSGTNGLTSNINQISFPQATADWNSNSPISYAAIYDSGTYGAGNMISCFALTSARTISSGATASFAAGALTFTIN